MSANKHLPHVLVLPEDDADRELANRFQLQLDSVRLRQMQVLEVAGGWSAVLERFRSYHVALLKSLPLRFMVLLIDFDGDPERQRTVLADIPPHLADRVFVLGGLSDPEDLKKALGPYETRGSALARDCRDETSTTLGSSAAPAQRKRG